MTDMDAESQGFPKCEIILNNFTENPACDHGPTVLFSRNGKRFFACSAFRSRNLCPFYLEEGEISKKKRNVTRPEINSLSHTVSSEDNKGQAQYYFSESTLQFILLTLKTFKVTNILCIGTPTIHRKFEGTSYLLDIDDKFESSEDNFSLYNMCNHHFFKNKANYSKFLEASENLTIICDPPFGARLELLLNTVRLIDDERKSLGHKKKTKVFLVNPYFSEGKIQKLDNTIRMCDYRIEYASHKKFRKGEKSPIRLFTNVDLAKLKLPMENYKYCVQCRKFVFNISKHCDLCQSCDSRDGRIYEHCFECKKCVKSSWSHCSKCQSCHFTGNCKMVGNKRKAK